MGQCRIFTNIFVFEDTFCSINEMTNESSNNSQHYQYILCMQCQSAVFIVTFSISTKLAGACQGIPAGCPTLLASINKMANDIN
jgi:hypothetical protein